MVIGDAFEIPKRARLSLSQAEGFKTLIELRNSAVAAATEQIEDLPQHDNAAMSLFAVSPTSKIDTKRIKPRLNASKLKELRDNPDVIDVTVPGAIDLSVSMLKPVHPCEDMWVRMDADSLEHIIMFIRDKGLALEDLQSRRNYRNQDVPEGVWSNGGGNLVRKLPAPEDGELDPGAKRWKKVNLDEHAPLQDAAHDAGAVADGSPQSA